jgi:hypothetical protein
MAPNRPLGRLLAVQQVAFWFVAQMTLYLDFSGVTFPSSGWTGTAMDARLLFWPPLLMVAIAAIGTVSQWRRLYTMLLLAALAQVGNGLIDLRGELRSPWLTWVSITLWVVFLGGLVALAVLAVRARGNQTNTPAPMPPSADIQ